MPNTNGPSTVTLSGAAAFTGAGTYICTINDLTSPTGQAKLVKKSGTSFTLQTVGKSARKDVIDYICVGS